MAQGELNLSKIGCQFLCDLNILVALILNEYFHLEISSDIVCPRKDGKYLHLFHLNVARILHSCSIESVFNSRSVLSLSF